jgi:hypothetical protein
MESKDGVVVILQAYRKWKKEPGSALGDFVTPEMVEWLLKEVVMLRTVTGDMLSELKESHDEIVTYLRVKRHGHRDEGKAE